MKTALLYLLSFLVFVAAGLLGGYANDAAHGRPAPEPTVTCRDRRTPECRDSQNPHRRTRDGKPIPTAQPPPRRNRR
jgi:hypothetical protein